MSSSLHTDKDPHFTDYLYAPNTAWTKPAPKWMKLPAAYSFDLEEARKEFELVRDLFPLKPFEILSESGKSRPRRTYRGLGLTSRAAAEDPLYDSLSLYGADDKKLSIYNTFKLVSDRVPSESRHIETLDETGFDQLTEACRPYFQGILAKFKSTTTKVRFLEMMPGGFIPPHVDFPFYQGIRVHACLYSNPDVVWEVEGEQFSIPCDGNFYWFDTGRYHAVSNQGDSSRVVISINLSPYISRDGVQLIDPSVTLPELITQARI